MACSPALVKEFGYKNVMAVPKIEKISINMGMGEATQNSKLIDGAVHELDRDRRSEAGHHEGEEVDRGVQAARRHADRLHGDAARRPDVRVLRPSGERGSAPRSRFPRRIREVLRRPRQLHAGHQRPVDLPGDRLQQGRENQGNEYQHHDDGAKRMPRDWLCCGRWACRSPVPVAVVRQ